MMSFEKLLDKITPEILGVLDIRDMTISPDALMLPHQIQINDFYYGNIIAQLYQYLPEKSIIQILNNIRIGNDSNAFKDYEDALAYMINNEKGLSYLIDIVHVHDINRICPTKIKFEINRGGELLESIVINDYSKIKNLTITVDNNTVIFDSKHISIGPETIKKYNIYDKYNGSIIKTVDGLLLSNYAIPLLSTIFQKTIITIEFYEEYNDQDEIELMFILINNESRHLLHNAYYELDMQSGKFLIFGGGMIAEHIIADYGDGKDMTTKYLDGTLNEHTKLLFDEAHKEADRRKSLL